MIEYLLRRPPKEDGDHIHLLGNGRLLELNLQSSALELRSYLLRNLVATWIRLISWCFGLQPLLSIPLH